MLDQEQIGQLDRKQLSFYFWMFLIIHTVLWTVGPAIFRYSVPHDTLESITWGQQWQLGYHKHPFLTAWLCAGITNLFGVVGWPTYLLAQLAVATTFIAVWQLAKKILPPSYALIAVLLTEGVLFNSINSFNLTPDTLQSPLWALLCLFFYQALSTQKMRYWLLTGLFAALCICTKYQGALLLFSMLLLCIINSQARLSFKKPGIYFAMVLFCLLMLPHLLWLFQHDFITLGYAQNVSKDYTPDKSLIDHLAHPAQFLINSVLNVIGILLLLWPFYSQPKSQFNCNPLVWPFLVAVGFGPFIITLLLCVLTGDYFPPRWSTPYFFALGVIALTYIRPKLSGDVVNKFAITLVFLSSLLFLSRMTTFTLFSRGASDAFLPNQTIALRVTKLWHDQYHTPLSYIAGSSYLVDLTTPYLTDKPQPYLNWLPEESPWIDEARLRQKGAVFIWDEGLNYAWDKDSSTFFNLPKSVIDRFPNIKIIPHYVFFRTSNHQPIQVGVAILPPQG